MLVEYYEAMVKLIKEAPPGKIVAIGKCGLDYSILNYADKTQQLDAFMLNFELAE